MWEVNIRQVSEAFNGNCCVPNVLHMKHQRLQWHNQQQQQQQQQRCGRAELMKCRHSGVYRQASHWIRAYACIGAVHASGSLQQTG
jgi:hypothetical protein